MTDYRQFYDSNGHLLKDDEPKTKPRCSGDTDVTLLVQLAKELNKLRRRASDCGVCLDELEKVAKELASD